MSLRIGFRLVSPPIRPSVIRRRPPLLLVGTTPRHRENFWRCQAAGTEPEAISPRLPKYSQPAAIHPRGRCSSSSGTGIDGPDRVVVGIARRQPLSLGLAAPASIQKWRGGHFWGRGASYFAAYLFSKPWSTTEDVRKRRAEPAAAGATAAAVMVVWLRIIVSSCADGLDIEMRSG